MSDRVRRISFFRSSTRLFSTESGTMNPTNVSRAMITSCRNEENWTICSRNKAATKPATAPMILNARTRSASHPAGLPASISFFSMRSRASSGVTRLAKRPARPTIGTSTREPKFSFSDSSRRLGWGAATPLGPTTWVSSRRTARCFSERV